MDTKKRNVIIITVVTIAIIFVGIVTAAPVEGDSLFDELWEAISGIEDDVEDLQTEVDLHAEIEYLRGIVEALQAQVNSFPNWPCLIGPDGPEGPPGPQGPMGSIPHASSYGNTAYTLDLDPSDDPVPISNLRVTLTTMAECHIVILCTVEYSTTPQGVPVDLQVNIEQIESSIPATPANYRCINPSAASQGTASVHFFKENLPAGTYDFEVLVDNNPGPIGGAILEIGHRAITVFAIPPT